MSRRHQWRLFSVPDESHDGWGQAREVRDKKDVINSDESCSDDNMSFGSPVRKIEMDCQISSQTSSPPSPMELDEPHQTVANNIKIGRSRSIGLKDIDLSQNSRAQYIKKIRGSPESSSPFSRQISSPASLNSHYPNRDLICVPKPSERKPVKPETFHLVPKNPCEDAVNVAFAAKKVKYFPNVISNKHSAYDSRKEAVKSGPPAWSLQTPPPNNPRPPLPTPSPPAVQKVFFTELSQLSRNDDEESVDIEEGGNERMSSFSDDDEPFDHKSPDNITVRRRTGKPGRKLGKNEKPEETGQSETKDGDDNSPGEETSLSSKNFIPKALFAIMILSLIIITCIYLNPSGFCLDSEFQTDIYGLEHAFDTGVFGQHLAKRVVLSALKSRFSGKKLSKKPLVLSFLGWTGSGKNYVSTIIAEHLFKNGMQSPFVHKIIIPLDFPHKEQYKIYRSQLKRWIYGNVTKCSKRSLFIFDEVDKIPPGLIEVLKPFLDHRGVVGNTDFCNAIFIFLSNTAGLEINKLAIQHFTKNLPREKISLYSIDSILEKLPNSVGNEWFKVLSESSLIDFIVPFLPLERTHVKQCIVADMKHKRFPLIDRIVEEVASQMTYFPPNAEIFSISGCKKVSSKVDVVVG